MKESRSSKYGRFLAEWVKFTINSLPDFKRDTYKAILVEQLKTYSFEPRSKGIHELRNMEDFNINEPDIQRA